MSAAAARVEAPARARPEGHAVWWPLLGLTLLAAVLRLSTLDLQSFWYDEAFTPVHVLHPSLSATLSAVSHTENSPPLWYLLEWLDYRILGSGEVALRLPSALAGIALVPVAWWIGQELAGRAAAIACAALIAVGPLFVWFSQEARVYSLFALTSAVAMLCFLRLRRRPDARRVAAFALAGVLALLTHYFAVFLLAGMAAWLLWEPATRRACLPALAAIGAVGIALIPLISAQGGHGTQWIGEWALSSRLQAVPQYYLTGYSGAPLGHGIELLVALPLLGAAGIGVWRMLELPPKRRSAAERRQREGAAIALWLSACGCLLPVALALAGSDYLAPRNLLAAMVPVSALIAVLATWPRAGAPAAVLLAIGVLGLLAITIDVDLSPRLQRGDWRSLAHALGPEAPGGRAITTVELGSAPLQYYIPGLRHAVPGSVLRLREVVETGYPPLRRGAGRSPAPGFAFAGLYKAHGLVAYRFLAPTPTPVSEALLRRRVITDARAEVLVCARKSCPGDARRAR